MKVRIEDKENVRKNGIELTAFNVYEFNADQEAYVFEGQFSTTGSDATDSQCEAEYFSQRFEE